MKKIILSSLLLCSIAVKAQFKIPLYIRAGMNSSNVKNSDSRIQKGPALTNIGLGLETIITLLKSKKENYLAFNPSVSYLPTGYNSSTGYSPYKVKVNYVSVGLPLNYFNHFNLFWKLMGSSVRNEGNEYLFFIGGGPYFNYATTGKFKLTAIDDYKKMSFGNGVNDNRKTTDAGIMINFGLKFNKLLWGFQKSIGKTNVIPSARIMGDEYIKTKNFMMYFSYNIGKK